MTRRIGSISRDDGLSNPTSVNNSMAHNLSLSYAQNDVKAINLPTFWEEDVELWFSTVDSQFAMYNITSPYLRYDAVIKLLGLSQLRKVEDLVAQRPLVKPYERLREALTKAFTDSDHDRLVALLDGNTVNDASPSKTLAKMRKLAGKKLIRDQTFQPLLKRLFINKMPGHVQELISIDLNVSLDELAERADNIMAVRTPKKVRSVSPQRVDGSQLIVNQMLERRIADLSSTVERMSTVSSESSSMPISQITSRRSFSGREERQDSNRPSKPVFHRKPVPNGSKIQTGLCFNHQQYGQKCYNCVPPCTWKQAGN